MFHNTLGAHLNSTMNVAIMTRIDSDLSVTNTKDPEVKQRWFPMGLYLGYS
jgi:hypothetical protein